MKPVGAPNSLQISLRRSAEAVLQVFIVDILDNDRVSQSFSRNEGIVSDFDSLADATDPLSPMTVSASKSLKIGRNKLRKQK